VTLWNQLAAPWRVSLEQAWIAYQAGSLPIGAAITDQAGSIVGRGRNRIFEPFAEPTETRCVFGNRLAHAEMNALLSIDHLAVDVTQCTLYTTLEPCALCVGAIRMLALKEVRFAARDPAAGSVALFGATDFMRRGGVNVEQLEVPDLEAVLIAMNTDALLSIAERFNLRPPIHRWEAAGLPGVAFGRELFASGQLRRLADGPGITIQHVLQELAGADRLEDPRAADIDAAAADGLDTGRPYPQPLVLIVTGAPASGKTTLGRQLATALQLPYFSKDLFKESLFDSLGWRDRAWSQRLGGASTRLLLRSAEVLLEARQSVLLECNFYAQWDTPQLHALRDRFACRFVQVVCTADGPTLVERYERRALSGERHPGHTDATSLDELIPRLLNERWEALDLDGPILTIDTTNTTVDVDALARRILFVSESRAV
jgi:tRNA(Arg) A34 adenosine deaminase TadA/predicted kinase